MKLSIRYQILATVLVLVVTSVGAYLVYATDYIVRDKLAYAYDLNASLAHTRAQEVRASIETLVGKLRLLAAVQPREEGGKFEDRVEPLFTTTSDVVSLELWEKRMSRWVQTHHVTHDESFSRLHISPRDLVLSHREAGLTPEVVRAEKIILRNTSLPPDTALITIALASTDGRGVIIADVEPTHLAQLLARSKLYQAYLVDAHGTVLAHGDRRRMVERENLAMRPSVAAALGSGTNRGVQDLESPDGPIIAAYSRLELGRIAIVTEIPKERALSAARVLTRRSILFGLFALLGTFVAAVLVSRRLARPLRELQQATLAVGRGDLGLQLPVHSGNEIGDLTRAFNAMSADLSSRDRDLKTAYSQLQHADRLALLGTVTAGVAHELKNPLTYVLVSQKFVKEYLHSLRPEGTVPLSGERHDVLADAIGAMDDLGLGLTRIQSVIADLGQVSRGGANEAAGDLDLREIIKSSVKMAAHQVGPHARITESYEDLPLIHANASRLGQVFLNLVINASQALPADGAAKNEIRLSARKGEQGWVVAEVADNGPGIPDHVLESVFDEFFTTKGNSGGTGLGLAISRSIIESLDGRIEVDTTIGLGSTFRIFLPSAETHKALEAAEPNSSGDAASSHDEASQVPPVPQKRSAG